MVDIEKLTNYSQELLNSAGVCMGKYRNSQIQPEHIMLAMIEDKGAIAAIGAGNRGLVLS